MKVYIGIDWSENKHDVCFLHETGEVLLVEQIPHTIAGFRQLEQARASLGVGRQEVIIGLETAHNLLVDYLWDQGYEQIYVLPPAAVKSAQKRYRQSGAKDDRWDAHLIANLLRTDQRCYTCVGYLLIRQPFEKSKREFYQRINTYTKKMAQFAPCKFTYKNVKCEI